MSEDISERIEFAKERVSQIYYTILKLVSEDTQMTTRKLRALLSKQFNISPRYAYDYIDVELALEEITHDGNFIVLTEKGCKQLGIDYKVYMNKRVLSFIPQKYQK